MKAHYLTKDDAVRLKAAISRTLAARIAVTDAQEAEATLRVELIKTYAVNPEKTRHSYSDPPIHEFSDCSALLLERV